MICKSTYFYQIKNKTMKIQIVAIGDEVLNGQVVNTNASWMAERLSAWGYYVHKMTVIPDGYEEIYDFISESFEKYELSIVTGGLGPTKDDITKKVFADYFQCGFKTDPATRERIESRFQRRGLPMLEANMLQASVPEVAEILPNTNGTAPGLVFKKNGNMIISLPGVPFEMRGILEEYGFACIFDFFKKENYYAKSVLLTGIGESFLAEKITDWENRLRAEGLELSYLPSVTQIKLRITAKHNPKVYMPLIDSYIEELKILVPENFFGFEDHTLSQVVGGLLKSKGLTIASMESCTGGGILNELIKTSGSSSYVKGGLITYTNEIKMEVGKISPATIEKYTELSEQCAREMAENAATIFQTDVGVGITGLLEVEKGKDTFAYISVFYKGNTYTQHKKFGDNRERNIQMSIFAALNFVRNLIKDENP